MNKYLNLLGTRKKLCNTGYIHEIEFSPKKVTNICNLITYSPTLYALQGLIETQFLQLYADPPTPHL